MNEEGANPIRFTEHARYRMALRGAREDDAVSAIRHGDRRPARRGLWQYELDFEFGGGWDGRFCETQRVAPIVAEEGDCLVVVTVLTFFFGKGGAR